MGVPTMLAKAGLLLRLVGYTIGLTISSIKRTRRLNRLKLQQSPSADGKPPTEPAAPQNIVVVGANFAGYHAARLIAASLPPDGPHRVVVVEPHSHFHFTWVLPRLCAVPGHEHKALIPYGPHLSGVAPADRVRWVTDRVSAVRRDGVVLERTGEVIPYAYLVVATGSGAGETLPSRVGADDKDAGLGKLREMQGRIKDAARIIVVGGGAAGVELATDAKHQYPEKHVVLVHSRGAVMHRFGPELQAAALAGLEALGVEVFLNERAAVNESGRVVTLKSGRKVECDLYISCVGQKPSSGIIADLAPSAISADGHIKVLPSLQIADETLPNVYACGDVADSGTRNPNARAAMKQAQVVADNIALSIAGVQPDVTYEPHWAEMVIKLTLGLDKSVTHFGDDRAEILRHAKEKDVALMVDGAWKFMGATPFEDETDELARFRGEL